MWIVKIGGSLCADPVLPQWLELLVQLGSGRVIVVGGGGSFADEVRRVQAHWQFDDLPAHNMAVMAMAQTAYQLQALNPALQLAVRKSDLARVLQRGKTAVWLPFEVQRDQADPQSNWGATSDTIAFDLARRLNAERLVLVKSCAIDPALGLAELCQVGIVDRGLAAAAGQSAFPIDVLQKTEIDRMRSMLLGEVRFSA